MRLSPSHGSTLRLEISCSIISHQLDRSDNSYTFQKLRFQSLKLYEEVVQIGNLSLRLGDATLEENRSNVSKNPSEAVQSRHSEVDQVGKRTPCASLCSNRSKTTSITHGHRYSGGGKKKRASILPIPLPERREPKPQIEMRPSGERSFSKSDS